jgi:hypothetical protein
VFFEYEGSRYRMASTGTFTAKVDGEDIEQEVWRDISQKATDNVYFEMELKGPAPKSGNGSSESAPEAGGVAPTAEPQEAIGIWTTHILLAPGSTLKESDLKGLYGG